MIYIATISHTDEVIDIGGLEEIIQNDFSLPVRRQVMDVAPERFYDPKRKQYHSTSILKELLYRFPPDAVKAIGIVPFDLFIPILTFVFGEAQLNGKVAVVSTARLEQSFYGMPSNPMLFERRLIKEIKHELGHTFGLLHCARRSCVMSLATSIADVDRKSLRFCNSCEDSLKSDSDQGFNIDL